MINQYSTRSSVFKGFNKNSFYNDPINGKERNSIFGYDQFKNQRFNNSSACCRVGSALTPGSGGYAMNSFFESIWRRGTEKILIENMAFGEDPCCETL